MLRVDPELQALQTSDTTFVLTSAVSFQLTRRDTLMCVLSACLLLTFCAAFAWERPNSNLQKHTVANCQGWSLSCYPPLCIKKLRFSLWCAGISVLLGIMPPAFLCIHPLSVQLTSVKSLHKWMLSSLHEMVLSLKKNTQHSEHTLQNRSRVLMWVFWRRG